MRERDLHGQDRVVRGHIGLRIVGAMLVLDLHAVAELLEVAAAPIDPDLVAYASGFLAIVTPERQRPAQGLPEASA